MATVWTNWAGSTTATSSNDYTWTTWTGSATTASTSGTDTAWVIWTTTGASSTTNSITYATDDTWAVWVNSSGPVAKPAQFRFTPPPAPTPEQLEARRLKEEKAKQEAEERERERDEAIARARALLMSCLGPTQKRDYKRKGCFTCRSGSGKRFRLGKGLPKELDKQDKAVASYCIHPVPLVPDGDRLLTEMLMLRYDEAEFLRIANKGYP